MNKGGMYVLQGRIELLSAARIGNGRSDVSDMDVLLDMDGKPYIPATSLVGVLRSEIGKETDPHDERFKRFWGFWEGDDGRGSLLSCSDLRCLSAAPGLEIRDGIRLNSMNGIVIKGGKFDHQVVGSGTAFALKMEAAYPAEDGYDEYVGNMLALIKDRLESGRLTVGARTTRGLGRIRLIGGRLSRLDFSNHRNVALWLLGKPEQFPEWSSDRPAGVLTKPAKPTTFVMEVDAVIRGSFIIRAAASADYPSAPDYVMLKSGGKPLISGSSWGGAVRARALRIANTLADGHDGRAGSLIHGLFGFVPTNKGASGQERPAKSRIRIDETELNLAGASDADTKGKGGYVSEQQSRIKIDRFTGGTVDGALFDTMPLFSDGRSDEGRSLRLRIEIDSCWPYEAGLMILVLKDLWTGDLAVGGEKGIGRGSFRGLKAEIRYQGKKIIIRKKDSDAAVIEIAEIIGKELNENREKGREQLAALVKALNEHLQPKGGDNA